MYKNLSFKYYKNTKERLQKRSLENIEVFPKKKKTKSDNMGGNNIKIFLKIKNKG